MLVPQQWPMRHQTIVVVDVAGYTAPARTAAHQRVVRDGMYQALKAAFTESGVNLETCHTEDRGDGVLILVPPEVGPIRLADALPNRLVAELRRHNAVHSAGAGIQLRMALHAGQVGRDERGVVGQAVNVAFRLVDAPEAKSALKSSTGVLGVIASDYFYHDVIVNDPAADADSYRKLQVSVKESEFVAWLRLPDRPATAEKARASHVLDLLPWPEMERLHGRLLEISVTRLPTLVQRAGGPSVAPAWNVENAWEAFSYLAEFNAGPDGFPPAFMFVELVARQVGGDVGAELMRWNEEQAHRLRLWDVLRERRGMADARVSDDARLHLMIVVKADAIDPDRLLVSCWRQDDPSEWPPPAGETQTVVFDELERLVDELVVSAERAWSGHGGSVALEFVLPRELLNLPVHRWHKEHDTGDPYPLCLDYPIVVRSLERMQSPQWHRAWHQRWWRLTNDPEAGIRFARPEDTAQPHRLAAVLSDPQWVSMVLSEEPARWPTPGTDELTAALRSGLPALMWHPEASAEGLREVVTQLVDDGGLRDLPGRAHASRRALFTAPEGPAEIRMVRDLVVLWDDPHRVVILDQPPDAGWQRGEISNDHERAS